MGFSKYWMLIVLALALVAFLWVYGRSIFTGFTKWLLWALGVLCACAGVVFLVTSEGKALPIVGGFLLWLFAAYVVKVAESARKRC